MQFVVQSTCVAHWFSIMISSPQRCVRCLAICTNYPCTFRWNLNKKKHKPNLSKQFFTTVILFSPKRNSFILKQNLKWISWFLVGGKRKSSCLRILAYTHKDRTLMHSLSGEGETQELLPFVGFATVNIDTPKFIPHSTHP